MWKLSNPRLIQTDSHAVVSVLASLLCWDNNNNHITGQCMHEEKEEDEENERNNVDNHSKCFVPSINDDGSDTRAPG